jgi:hypothetical protein
MSLRRHNRNSSPAQPRLCIQRSANFVELIFCALKGERVPDCEVRLVIDRPRRA